MRRPRLVPGFQNSSKQTTGRVRMLGIVPERRPMIHQVSEFLCELANAESVQKLSDLVSENWGNVTEAEKISVRSQVHER